MQVAQILEELQALADPRAKVIWQKMGLDPTNYYGVGLTKLKEYAKRLGKSHDLAGALWASGIHDARLLATMIEEPKQVTEAQLDQWLTEVDFWDLSDKLCTNVAAKTGFGPRKMRTWVQSEAEWIQRSGYILLAELAKSSKELTETELADYLAVIEREIHPAKNWVREAMNLAVIGIGSRNRALNEQALATARRIGKVAVDYGETSCQVPDAVVYLTKPALQTKLK